MIFRIFPFLPNCYKALGLAFLPLVFAGNVLAATSDWRDGYGGKIRLVSAGTLEGDLKAGIEIQMQDGWKTYWKVPGDSGIPPTFDFSASRNVEKVEILWPAPARYGDEVSQMLGYKDWIIFPLKVTPKDKSLPVTLNVDANIGICSDLCVPVSAQMQLDVPKGGDRDFAQEVMIDRDLALVPGKARQSFQIQSVDQRKAKGKPDRLTLTALIPDGLGKKDLFVEGPKDWFLPLPQPVKGQAGQFELVLDGLPKEAKTKGAALTFTLTNGDEAVSQTIRLKH